MVSVKLCSLVCFLFALFLIGKASQVFCGEKILGFTAQESTYIDINNRTTNYGKNTFLSVSWNKTRTIVQFGELQTLQPASIIIGGTPVVQEAVLRFPLVYQVQGSFQLAAHKLDRLFKQNEATWDCSNVEADCCNQWYMSQLNPEVKPSFQITPLSVQNVSYLNERRMLDFNVTSAVQYALDQGDEKIGFLVKEYCEEVEGSLKFWSCETNDCPQLLVYVKFFCQTNSSSTPSTTENCKDKNLQWNWDN